MVPSAMEGGRRCPLVIRTCSSSQCLARTARLLPDGLPTTHPETRFIKNKRSCGMYVGRGLFAVAAADFALLASAMRISDEPPYHVPAFVLTHHPRPPLEMKGGTTFHFVTTGIEDALRLAIGAAHGKDVRLGGGVATIRQYLRAGLIDELRLTISPVLLGTGEHLLSAIDTRELGYECVEHTSGRRAAAHVVLRKTT